MGWKALFNHTFLCIPCLISHLNIRFQRGKSTLNLTTTSINYCIITIKTQNTKKVSQIQRKKVCWIYLFFVHFEFTVCVFRKICYTYTIFLLFFNTEKSTYSFYLIYFSLFLVTLEYRRLTLMYDNVVVFHSSICSPDPSLHRCLDPKHLQSPRVWTGWSKWEKKKMEVLGDPTRGFWFM